MDRIALSRLGGLGLLGLVAAGAGACAPQSGASFSPTTGVLSIRGTASGDVYVVSVAAGAIVVNGGQVPIRGGVPTVANTLRIEMRGAEGVDLLELDESGGPLPDARIVGGPGADVLVGGSGDDTIEGGTGDDLVLLGPGADTAVWRAGDGLDTVEGEEDADTLRVEGSDVDERVDVVAVSGRVHFVRDVDAVTLDVAGIETVHFLARGGADTIVLGDVSGTGMALLDVDLAASVGGPDGFADAITWSGTNGADAIALAGDAASAQLDAAVQAGLRVTAQEAADRLTLNALGGDDAVDGTSADLGLALVANLGLGVDTYLGTDGAEIVTGGDGNDHVLLGGGDDEFVWNPGDDSDIVDGEAGWDRLRFNGANVGESIDFAAFGGRISLSRNVALVALDLGTLEAISLRMLGGTDLVAVGDLSGTGLAELDVDLASAAGVGDAMADAVIAFGTPGADVVALGGDASSVEVLGLPTSITLANTDGPLDSLSLQTLGGEDSVHAGDLLATAPKLTVEGGAQDDVLVGGDGDDSLLGDDGDDVLIGGPGLDLLDGGAGSNIVIQ